MTNQNNRSLRFYVLSSWLLSGFIALIASVILLFSFGYYSYQQSQNRQYGRAEEFYDLSPSDLLAPLKKVDIQLVYLFRFGVDNLTLEFLEDI